MKNISNLKKQIPKHLGEFIVEQDASKYSAINHAVWRYSLRQLTNFLADNAHECYLEGLEKTGITVDSIPSVDDICAKLKDFGWSAVPVSGFIPPAAFMEMQSLGILPIARDMRSREHTLYTPAPDIVHEAAGHAPILINKEFAHYLKQYASVAKMAIVSSQDLQLYEAIRELSDIKEHPHSTAAEIKAAEDKLNDVSGSMTVTSEATLLGRMNWWTAEYGLIGDLENPKIYGAGLLSSYGEARECLTNKVKKIPLTVDCIDYSYDITEPQPQLFVAQSFTHLTDVLQQLAARLSYKRGGLFGLNKAIEAQTVNTVQLNSGLQISGKVTDAIEANGECIYFRTEGPTQLCVGGNELNGHDKSYHAHGYSSPLGFIDGLEDCLSWASDDDLKTIGLFEGKQADLNFESGIQVSGQLVDSLRTQRGELCLLSFENCTVTYKDRTLFQPDWGTFDMAVGSKVDSVFSGPADRKAYGLTDRFTKKTVPVVNRKPSHKVLNEIYQDIRNLRDQKGDIDKSLVILFNKLESDFPQEWLARLEILEIIYTQGSAPTLETLVLDSLNRLQKTDPLKRSGYYRWSGSRKTENMNNLNIVLVRPKYSRNVGMVSRIMSNFGILRLILVDPQCEMNEEARQGAAQGQAALENVTIYPNWKSFYDNEPDSLRLAFSRRQGKRRTSLSLQKTLAIGSLNWRGPLHFIFGAEDHGLNSDDLTNVHRLAFLELPGDLQSMNLSHSVLAATQIHFNTFQSQPHDNSHLGTTIDPEPFLKKWLEALHFDLDSQNRWNALTMLKQLILRASPSEEEIHKLKMIVEHTVRKIRS